MRLSYAILVLAETWWLVLGGKMYTPINPSYKVACLPEQIKVCIMLVFFEAFGPCKNEV